MRSLSGFLAVSFLDVLTRRISARAATATSTKEEDSPAKGPSRLRIIKLSTSRCTCRLRELCRERGVTATDVEDVGLVPPRFRAIRAGRVEPSPVEQSLILAVLNDRAKPCIASKPAVRPEEIFGGKTTPKNCTCELRLKLDATGLTNAEIGRFVGVKTQVVNQWRAGVTVPTHRDLVMIDAIEPVVLPFAPTAEAGAR